MHHMQHQNTPTYSNEFVQLDTWRRDRQSQRRHEWPARRKKIKHVPYFPDSPEIPYIREMYVVL